MSIKKSELPTSKYSVACDTFDMVCTVKIHKADGNQKLHLSMKPENGEAHELSLFKEDVAMFADAMLSMMQFLDERK